MLNAGMLLPLENVRPKGCSGRTDITGRDSNRRTVIITDCDDERDYSIRRGSGSHGPSAR